MIDNYHLQFLPVFHENMNILSHFLSTRNLPDVTAEDFSKVDLRQFKWIHWEVSEMLGQTD